MAYNRQQYFTLFCFVGLSFWLACFPMFSSAEEPIKNVRFVEEANWPPFTPDKFGIAEEGLSLQLMQGIFSRLQVNVEVELLPQRRMLEYLKNGQRDGATVISINADRAQYLEFTDPIFAKRGYVYYSSDRKDPLVWDEYKDLQGFAIGIVDGHNYGAAFDEAVTELKLKVVVLSRAEQGFDLLLANRLDCFLCINLTANYFLQQQKYAGKIMHAPKSYYSKDYHVAFSKKSRACQLIPQVNRVIKQMQKDGSLVQFLSPYIQ